MKNIQSHSQGSSKNRERIVVIYLKREQETIDLFFEDAPVFRLVEQAFQSTLDCQSGISLMNKSENCEKPNIDSQLSNRINYYKERNRTVSIERKTAQNADIYCEDKRKKLNNLNFSNELTTIEGKKVNERSNNIINYQREINAPFSQTIKLSEEERQNKERMNEIEEICKVTQSLRGYQTTITKKTIGTGINLNLKECLPFYSQKNSKNKEEKFLAQKKKTEPTEDDSVNQQNQNTLMLNYTNQHVLEQQLTENSTESSYSIRSRSRGRTLRASKGHSFQLNQLNNSKQSNKGTQLNGDTSQTKNPLSKRSLNISIDIPSHQNKELNNQHISERDTSLHLKSKKIRQSKDFSDLYTTLKEKDSNKGLKGMTCGLKDLQQQNDGMSIQSDTLKELESSYPSQEAQTIPLILGKKPLQIQTKNKQEYLLVPQKRNPYSPTIDTKKIFSSIQNNPTHVSPLIKRSRRFQLRTSNTKSENLENGNQNSKETIEHETETNTVQIKIHDAENQNEEEQVLNPQEDQDERFNPQNKWSNMKDQIQMKKCDSFLDLKSDDSQISENSHFQQDAYCHNNSHYISNSNSSQQTTSIHHDSITKQTNYSLKVSNNQQKEMNTSSQQQKTAQINLHKEINCSYQQQQESNSIHHDQNIKDNTQHINNTQLINPSQKLREQKNYVDNLGTQQIEKEIENESIHILKHIEIIQQMKKSALSSGEKKKLIGEEESCKSIITGVDLKNHSQNILDTKINHENVMESSFDKNESQIFIQNNISQKQNSAEKLISVDFCDNILQLLNLEVDAQPTISENSMNNLRQQNEANLNKTEKEIIKEEESLKLINSQKSIQQQHPIQDTIQQQVTVNISAQPKEKANSSSQAVEAIAAIQIITQNQIPKKNAYLPSKRVRDVFQDEYWDPVTFPSNYKVNHQPPDINKFPKREVTSTQIKKEEQILPEQNNKDVLSQEQTQQKYSQQQQRQQGQQKQQEILQQNQEYEPDDDCNENQKEQREQEQDQSQKLESLMQQNNLQQNGEANNPQENIVNQTIFEEVRDYEQWDQELERF